MNQIINCIWNHPEAPVVYLACDMLGQEDILLQVSATFGSKIYVDKATNVECYRSLMVIVPEIVTEDASSRFHIFSGFPKLYERASAEARSKLESEPLIIRPSAQWYVCDDEDHFESGSQIQKQRKVRFSEAVKDEFGIWHVCYSMHSSKEELESAMQLLSPKWVVSTVPSCRAMELNYVKKNCFISRFSPHDPFWKLLDIDMGVAAADDSHTVTLMSEEHALDSASSKIEHVEKESCISFSSNDTSKDLSGDLRKLYRSMNAPVPRPLPSLMELMNARKRSRNHLGF